MLDDDSASHPLFLPVPSADGGPRADGFDAGSAPDGEEHQVAPTGNTAEPYAVPGGIPGGCRPAGRQAALPYVVAALLLGFGIYESVLYFGHKVVPNSDAPSFVRVGRELLSFQVPSSFKRAPVVGLLAAGLSHFVGGPHPELTAGWLLNALLHPLTLVLIWLIARRVIGRWAWCIALVTALNPWWLLNLREPVAETTLHFFLAATFYAIFTRSRWRYVLASLAALVRYDAGALLLVIFLLDMVQSRTTRQRARRVASLTVAALPLGLWLFGTVLHFGREGTTHYLNEMGTNAPLVQTLSTYLVGTWTVVISPLFRAPVGLSANAATVFSLCVGIPLFFGFCLGIVQAGAERRWEMLGLLTFLLAYLVVHGLHSFVLPRFCSTLVWMVLLVTAYGLRSGWLLLRTRIPPCTRSIFVLQGAGVLLAGLWAANVAAPLSDMATYSTRSVSVPYVAVALVCLLLTAEWLCSQQRRPLREVLVLVSLCLIILSNQGKLMVIIGNGRQDIEFKLLADWYRHNAGPRDKLTTTYAEVLGLYLPNHRDNLVPTAQLKADDQAGFLRNCQNKGITWLAWDSRLGRHPENRYYRYYGLAHLAPLAAAESWGPFEFVIQFQVSKERWINIFRWRPCACDPSMLPTSGSDPNGMTSETTGDPDGAQPVGIPGV